MSGLLPTLIAGQQVVVKKIYQFFKAICKHIENNLNSNRILGEDRLYAWRVFAFDMYTCTYLCEVLKNDHEDIKGGSNKNARICVFDSELKEHGNWHYSKYFHQF